MDASERRRAQRVRVDLRVHYRRADGTEAHGTIENISAAGVLLVGGEELAPGSRLELRFDDPAGRRHEVTGEVVRSAPKGGFAVAFVHVEEATLEYVRDALAPG